jgi:trehalose 6-phosphate synthase
MPLDERCGRHSALVKVLSENDIKDWGPRFVAALTNPAEAKRWSRRASG